MSIGLSISAPAFDEDAAGVERDADWGDDPGMVACYHDWKTEVRRKLQ